jgi:hypothetical protein
VAPHASAAATATTDVLLDVDSPSIMSI